MSQWIRTPFSGWPDNKLDAFIRAIDDVSIVEVVRSGVSGISRGGQG